MVGLTHHIFQVCCSQSPCPHSRLLLTHAGDTQTLKNRSGSVSCGVPGSWHAQGFVSALRAPLEGMGFDSKCDFSPPTLFEASPLPLDAVSFLGRLHHSPVSGCSAVRCDLGVLRGEDTRTSFYSAIFWVPAFPHLSVIREVQIQMVYHE